MNAVANSVVISGTGLYTPPYSISNKELVTCFNQYVHDFNTTNAAAIAAGDVTALEESSEAFIEKASGIKARYVVEKEGVIDPKRMFPHIPDRPNEVPSIMCDMSVAAAKEAMQRANCTAQDIDVVIVACSNLQRAYPGIAVEVQKELGIDGYSYDMVVGCSSATFGIQAAVAAIQSRHARRVLIINPEITSGHINWRDRDSHFIFGDACTAIVLERADLATSTHQFGIVNVELKSQFSNNIRNNFGYLNRADEDGVGRPDKLFKQQGRKVFRDVCPMAAAMITSTVEKADLKISNISRFWLHQANLHMNQLIIRTLLGRDASPQESPTVLDEYGNTSSAGSIIAFHKHQDDLPEGALGVICSFGAGYSIGCVVVKKL